MTEIIYDKKDIIDIGCKKISRSINKILDKKEIVIFGTAGGSSIKKIFKNINKIDIRWEKIHIFMADERYVPIDSKYSNFHLVKESLEGLIPVENLHPFFYDKKNPISEYEKEFKKYSDKCDIILLSSGEDGHIASIFPDHHSMKDESDYFIKVDNSPKPPSERISMSKKLISKSEISYLFIIGDSKKESYKKYLDEKIDIRNCPSKLVNFIDKSYILTDIKT